MTKGLVARLALLTASIGLSLVMAEVGLRLLWGGEVRSEADLSRRLEGSSRADLSASHGRFSLFGLVRASDHERVVYELKSGLAGTFRGQAIRTNQAGLRQDREVATEKARGVFRVVGLGDSHMFGWGVAQEETYLSLLDERLNRTLLGLDGRRGVTRVEVLNCAVPGFNTAMEVAIYEHKCSRFDPDLVILHVVGNDFDLPHFLQPLNDSGAAARPRLHLWSLLRVLVGSTSDSTEPDLLPHDIRLLPEEERHATRRQYAEHAGEQGMRAALERLAELVGESGVPVVVLMLGKGGEARDVAQAEASRLGFEVVDAVPHFSQWLEETVGSATRDEWRSAFVLPNDGHPTAQAHRRYSEVLEEVVLRYLRAGGATIAVDGETTAESPPPAATRP